MIKKLQALKAKKGFTLVELVVVIDILAILAAIAIPVVSSTITSSQRSSAKANAQTIETAIKEADAAISAKDDTVFVNKTGATAFKASSGSLTLQNISDAKAIDSAITATYQIDGVQNYIAYYDNDTQKVVFLGQKSGTTGYLDVDGKAYTTGTSGVVALSTTSNNKQVVATVSFNGTGKATQGTTGGGTTNTP